MNSLEMNWKLLNANYTPVRDLICIRKVETRNFKKFFYINLSLKVSR